MKITLRIKFIVFAAALVTVIMATVTYFVTIRELQSKREAVSAQIERFARNIATLRLLDRQEWDVYQNYITQLMAFNPDIIYIAVYDDRRNLRAHTLNKDLIDLEIAQPLLTRRREAEIVERLDGGAVAPESRADLRTERVNILVGDRVLGSVHVGFSIIDINNEMKSAIRLNIALALVFIVLFTGISAAISRRLTGPLERLTTAMKGIHDGDLSQTVNVTTHDEIAELSETFNQMVDGLRERRIIDQLGQELGATFQFDQLAPLIRERLKGAIGAASARLYIQKSARSGILDEITAVDTQHRFPPLHLSASLQGYLKEQVDGFMILSAPEAVLDGLRHRHSREDGLVLPMVVKDELFGILFFALPPDQSAFSEKQIRFAVTLAGQAALALENTLLYEQLREQERLKRELEIAREVQQNLLPRAMPHFRDLEFDAVCRPAYEVGGDYFDFFQLDETHLGIVVADVSGKGTSASFYMAELKGMMVQLAEAYHSPAALLTRLNRHLYRGTDRHIFITMIYGVLNTTTRRFTFSRAGHNALLKINREGREEFIRPTGIGLGMDSGKHFDSELREHTLSLSAGETVILYTDGLTEAMNSRLEHYGEDRLLKIVRQHNGASLSKRRNAILGDLHGFLNNTPPMDDITLVMFRYHSEKGNKM